MQMNEKLSWDEIKTRHDNEWVLLEEHEWPENEVEPRAGIVKIHAKTREEFDQIFREKDDTIGDNIAIIFTGSPRLKGDFGPRFVEFDLDKLSKNNRP
jgi:hypothetical protein